jgi:LSD1 subclass zinc finger protein
MGLYPIDCVSCKKPFMWFSGCLDQRCGDCQVKEVNKGEGKKMKKSEMETKIKELELKIAALEARPQVFCAGHSCHCNITHPTWINPYNPWGSGTICSVETGGIQSVPTTVTFGKINS